MIVEDTRQQAGKHDHIERWMRAHGVEFSPRARALPFGDYMRDGSNVSVDTKKDVQELVMDVGRDHARFVRECERAREAGYKLVILVESTSTLNHPDLLKRWTNRVCKWCNVRRATGCDPHKPGKCAKFRKSRCKPMQGETLYKTLKTLERRHGVSFEFCSKSSSARRICELLGVPYD